MILQITEAISQEIIGSGKPIVIMVSAPWCAPCKIFKPTFTKLAEQYKDKIMFATIDSDMSPNLCASFAISAIPTFLFIRDSKLEDRLVGVPSENKFIEKINLILS